MKILFLGTLYREEDEQHLLKKSKTRLQTQANSFQWALIRGLDSILKARINILNVLPVGSYPKHYDDYLLKSQRWSHQVGANDFELGSINLPFLKQTIRTVLCKKVIQKWIKNNYSENELHIIIYSNYLPFLMAVKNLPDKVKVTLIVTDLPQYDDLTSSNNLFKNMFRSINNKLIYKSLNRIDSFVILTEQMKEPMSIASRPYVVIEGLVDASQCTSFGIENYDVNKKVILYTGTLTLKFGIMNLLDAFALIDNDNYELWICGSGETEKEIRKRCEADSRIKYMGYIGKREIRELQQKVTVLVNPRLNDNEYTKYSFPSKTMEYMLSGKPVIMYKLDGIPEEYDQYLFYINGNKPKDMANKLREVCEKPQTELFGLGQKARQFVLEKKNGSVQAKKIIDMINMTPTKN